MRLLNATDVTETLAETDVLGGAFSLDRWAYAGRMTLIGMVMIFSVLAILWGVLVIFEKLMSKASPKPTAVEPTPAPAVAPVVEEVPVASVAEDEIIAAVIAAAVAAYMADGGSAETVYNGGFRVVSFRRVQGGKAWNSKN
ncbi:MAG: OadG family protein [Clostridia bacterium]|nr:OadG family protein [Clostridia bacterium]